MQILKDFMLRLQSEKKMQFIVGAVVLCVALMFILPSGGKQRSARQLPAREPKKPALVDKDAYKDLVERLTPELDQQRSDMNTLKEQLARTNEKIDENAERVATIFQTMMEKMASQPAGGNVSLLPVPTWLFLPHLQLMFPRVRE